jgi:cytochrome P450
MNAPSAAPIHWDPYNPKYFADPYPVFRRLREEAPVYYNAEYDFFAVSRYEDVERGLGDRDTFPSGRGGVLELIKGGAKFPKGAFIFEDPPLHGIHRGVLTKVFTPKRMSALEPQIRAFCARALDPLVAGGEFNFIDDLGRDMPMRVIGMLLGIPEDDLKAVQKEADDKLRTEPGKPMDYGAHNMVGEGFEDYIAWRAKHPSDDLMTELLCSEIVDETGATRRLTQEEVVIFSTILAGAGNETTNRLIGWTGKLLAEHPDQRRAIHQDRKLINQSIEEILRYEPPGPSVARYVAKDTEFQGVKVPEGSAVCFLVAAANRDERKIANAEAFDIHRERVPHLTFGYGFHACLGNALARVEGRVALDEVISRFPDWEVDLEAAELSSTSTVRGFETLPAFTPKAAKTRTRKPAATSTAAVSEIPQIAGAEVWKITLQTPAGPQTFNAQFVREGGSFSGRLDSDMGSEEVTGGKIAGDTLSWTMAVKKPMPIKLEFEAKIDGDRMSGHAKLGMFGKSKLAGERL